MSYQKLAQKTLEIIYPSHLSKIFTTRDGSEILIRPIKFVDANLLIDLFNSLSENAKYMRFLTIKKEMTLEEAKHFVDVDYDKSFALVAIPLDCEKEKIIGVARYYANESKNKAEIAILVTDKWQNKGIGTELNKFLLIIAKNNGIKKIYGDSLLENTPIKNILNCMDYEVKKTYFLNTFHFEFSIK